MFGHHQGETQIALEEVTSLSPVGSGFGSVPLLVEGLQGGSGPEFASSGELSFALIQAASGWSVKRSPLSYINQDHVDEAVAVRFMVSSIYYGEFEVNGIKVEDDDDDLENVPQSVG